MHLTRDRSGGGKNRTQVRVHGARLADQDVTTIDGVAATSLGRTVLDLCRTLPIEQAVAAGDRALAYGLVVDVLEEALLQLGRIVLDGLPAPEPQQVIRSPAARSSHGSTSFGRNRGRSGSSTGRSRRAAVEAWTAGGGRPG